MKSLLANKEWLFPVAVLAFAALLHLDSRADAVAFATGTDDAQAEEASQPNAQDRFSDQLAQAVGKLYPGARIALGNQVHWTRGKLSPDFSNVSALGESSRGEIMFSVTGASGRRDGEGWVGFSAWMPARVAIKRVHPGERLSEDSFSRQDVNVAVGSAHDLRGLIHDPLAALSGLEARQSVLEGSMLLSSSVQRTPDVRRGDAVRVRLISNGLSLMTQGTADEPAYQDGQIHVTASKTKRSLVGTLLPTGIVEVKL